MLQLKGGFLQTGRKSGQWMCQWGPGGSRSPQSSWVPPAEPARPQTAGTQSITPQNQEWDGRRGAIPLTPALCGCAQLLVPGLSIPQLSRVVYIASSSWCRGSGRERLSRVNLKDLEQQESPHRHPDGLWLIPVLERMGLLLRGCSGDLAAAWLCSSSSEC